MIVHTLALMVGHTPLQYTHYARPLPNTLCKNMGLCGLVGLSLFTLVLFPGILKAWRQISNANACPSFLMKTQLAHLYPWCLEWCLESPSESDNLTHEVRQVQGTHSNYHHPHHSNCETQPPASIALLVKVSSGVKKGTKMSKVDLCFSSNKLTKWYLL